MDRNIGTAADSAIPRARASSVVLLGDTNVDVVLEIDELPAPGADALAHGQRAGVGGSATNTAIMLQRLGLSCTMFACVGRDHWADLALTELEHEGIDTAHIVRHDLEPTSLNVVAVTPDGERTMFAYRGASAWLPPEAIDRELIGGANALHLSGYALLTAPQRDAALAALTTAREADVTTCLDVPVPAADAARREILTALPDLDAIVVGLPEARLLTGIDDAHGATDALLQSGVGLVAMKLGAEGSLIASASARARVPAPRVVSVDSTGAGDSFAAGVLAGLCRGAPPRVLGTLANACGAAAIQHKGAGRSLPQPAQVHDVLAGADAPDRDSDTRAALALVDSARAVG